MLTDDRYKQLMEGVGMPNSRSLLQALQQCAMEAALAEREVCIKICDRQIELQEQTGASEDAINQALRCADAIRAR